ncbi:inactive leucine-rich repeat receptor-like serine/threonine-protein kinase At1g60630 [Impatiens glandulifera]|uniref:inactive leucine-rich repeat receptor-like serine/threonine-protein kinase At1g60630 n=1 Tax=Impatiens glandulifera TaxID=253017 RepID=UPI001FB04F72|nr:inactive leucine-rich repeat receptor-like serine/threonine-protein kinase At1g60630 [Impatiens glandulifera]
MQNHLIFLSILLISFQSSISFAIDAGNHYIPDERDALIQLRDSLNSKILHANWTGPPCYKNQTRWIGIDCYDWHVTSIILDNLNLSGSLPSNISALRSLSFLTRLSLAGNSISGRLPDLKGLYRLESISLSSNRFFGPIPYEYVGFPKLFRLDLQENSLSGSLPPFDQQSLRVFNVSRNRLSGSIPVNSVLGRFSANSFRDNAGLCGPPLVEACSGYPPSIEGERKRERRNVIVRHPWIVALIAVLTSSFMVVMICCYCRNIRKKKARQEKARRKMQWSNDNNREESKKKGEELEFVDENRGVKKFNMDDLLKAPGEVIGKGEMGSTYKALIEAGGPAVAVKRLKYVESLKRRDFVQQTRLIGNLRHENLVEIICFYYSKKDKLIVYDFVPNIGNLFQLLHG